MHETSNPEHVGFVPTDLDVADFSALSPLLDALDQRPLEDLPSLEAWLADFAQLSAAIHDHASRCQIRYACQTDDPEAEAAYMHFVQQIAPRLAPRSFALYSRLLACPAHRQLDASVYDVLVQQWESEVALFREANIPLKTQLTQITSTYDKCTGAMTVTWEGQPRTLAQMGRFLESPDRAQREAAWRVVAQRRFEDRQTITDLFDQQLALRHRIAEQADCPDYRAYIWRDRCRFDYSPEDCLGYGDAVAQLLMPLREKRDRQRADQLGLTTLRPWDMAVDPLGCGPLEPFAADDVDAMLAGAAEVFTRLGGPLAEMFSRLRPGRHLDLISRKGKRSGGFQACLPLTGEPFIFMNAAGLQRDVETLLHEAGHAFHYQWAWETQPLCFVHHAPLEFCEVASMAMELFALDHLDVFYPDPADANRARQRMLEGIVEVLPWIAVIDGFQHWLYTHPGHDHAQRQDCWLGLLERFSSPLIDWSGLEAYRQTLWHRQLHLFHSPFYYIEYGLAQLGAIQLWQQFRQDPRKSLDRYQQALSLGNTRSLRELYAAAGITLAFDVDAMRPCVEAIEDAFQQGAGG